MKTNTIMKTRLIMPLLFWIVVIPAVASALLMWLWNGVLPDLLGVASIGFWQAVKLFFLCQLLFGGFGLGLLLLGGLMHVFSPGHHRAVHEKWTNMTDEQRREFIMARRKAGFKMFFGKEEVGKEEHRDSQEETHE